MDEPLATSEEVTEASGDLATIAVMVGGAGHRRVWWQALREARQDWNEGDAALEVRDVPIGGGGCDTKLVRSDPRPH